MVLLRYGETVQVAKRRFFARIFEMCIHFIISGRESLPVLAMTFKDYFPSSLLATEMKNRNFQLCYSVFDRRD